MNLSIPLLSAVDTAVAGHLLSSYQIGAIGLGALFYGFVFWLLSGLRMSTVGLFARWHKEGARKEAWMLLVRATVIGLTVGVVVAGLAAWWAKLAGWWVESSPRLENDMMAYLEVRFLAGPAAFIIVLMQSWFYGQGKVGKAVVLVVFANVLNAVLDVIFVAWLGLGITGLAWASVAAQWASLLLGLSWLYWDERGRIPLFSWQEALNWQGFKQLLGLNANLFVRTLLLQLSIIYLTSQAAQLGELTLAAFTIGWQMTMMASYLLDGFAHAAEVLVGQAIGQRSPLLLKKIIKRVLAWGMLGGCTITLIYGLLLPWWPKWFTREAAVLALLPLQLPWILLVPISGNLSFSLDGIFIGASAARRMRNSMLLSTIGCFFPLAWLLGRQFGIHGLWAAYHALYLARTFTLGLSLKRLQTAWAATP